MANKFGNGTGANVTNQRKRYETTNQNFVGSWPVRRFVTKREARGFTLIELLVSVVIFSVITTAVVTNFRASQRQSDLRAGAREVAAQIRALQTMAQSGERAQLCVRRREPDSREALGCEDAENGGKLCALAQCSCGCDLRVPAGYGIFAAADQFIVFADGNDNGLFDAGEQWDEESMELSESVRVFSVNPVRALDSGLHIVATPPFGQLRINGLDDEAAPDDASITVAHRQGGQTRTISIFRISGRVEIDL